VLQSTSPLHQFFVEGIFSFPHPEVVEPLLNQAIRNVRIITQHFRQNFFPWSQRTSFPKKKQPGRNPRLTPSSISPGQRFHASNIIIRHAEAQNRNFRDLLA
jgi:hypothetical protein